MLSNFAAARDSGGQPAGTLDYVFAATPHQTVTSMKKAVAALFFGRAGCGEDVRFFLQLHRYDKPDSHIMVSFGLRISSFGFTVAGADSSSHRLAICRRL